MSANLLSNLVLILPGHPFRGAITPSRKGDARVVQMRDVSPNGDIGWGDMVKTQLTGRRKPDWLQAGDILLVARGQRRFAVYLDDVPCQAVPANQFIHLRLKPELSNEVLPAFIAWQINQRPVQEQLESLATGTHLPSVSKSSLSKLTLAIPDSIGRQAQIVKLDQQIKEETLAYQALIANRQELLCALAVEIAEGRGD